MSKNLPAKLVKSAALVVNEGDFFFDRSNPDQDFIIVMVPNDKEARKLPIVSAKAQEGWTLEGSDVTPTLKPSIDAIGVWHGYLTNGVFVDCGSITPPTPPTPPTPGTPETPEWIAPDKRPGFCE